MTPTDIPVYMAHLGTAARAASTAMARAPLAARNAALRELARLLRAEMQALQQANQPEVAAAAAAGLQPALVDRLKLTPAIIETVALGCEQIAAMPDPIGEITDLKRQP
ncbi:MAG TPA: gamma-glutamyl-phosphate reductase, partial [Burkholderiaceae bacterium]|nr:gamma-glutamyl-phosphate reductase [Burkholderiaceae bacterium]